MSELLLHYNLTGQIIGAYYHVYNRLSHTYPERIYENAMMQELRRRGIPVARQEEFKILYKKMPVGLQKLDLFVDQEIVVELKAAPRLTRLHEAQTYSYLKATKKEVGLLFNFGGAKPQFKRLFFSKRPNKPYLSTPQQLWPDLLFPEISYRVIGGLFEVHNELGAGFIHRIYANACYREMQRRGFEVKPLREMAVFLQGSPVGQVSFGHILIEGKIMLFPVAITESNQIKQSNLRHWMRDQGISLGILANFHATSVELTFMKNTDN